MLSSRHFPVLRRFLFAFLFSFLFLTGLTGCGTDGSATPEITVLVDVAGLNPDIASLFVTSTLNNGQPQSSPEVTSHLEQFAIALPITTSGHLIINVVGRSAEHCVVASGQVAVDVSSPPTRYEVSVTLAASANAVKSCTLTLNVLGQGTVTSTPPGIQCVGTSKLSTPTTCSYDFPVGTAISLKTTADPKIYGTSYSGLCTGTSDCSLTFNAPGTVTAGIANRVCSNNSWCWYNPLPQGNALRAIWGVATNDIWAVGDAGTIMHYDGANWSSPLLTGTATTQDLYALYGTSGTDIWAVGNGGALVHWDGTTWTNSSASGLATTQILRGVWGSGKEYWAVGYSGTILHYDGTSWSPAAGSGQVATANLYSIWGSAPGDIWAVGSGAVIIHYNGTAWATDPKSGTFSSFLSNLLAVGGTGQNNVWAVGSYTLFGIPISRTIAIIIHYDGTTWTAAPATGTNSVNAPTALWNGSSTSVWLGGYATSLSSGASGHYDGAMWTTQNAMTANTSINGIWGSSESDLWMVGNSGVVTHFNGQAWSTPPLATPPTASTPINSIWANSASDIWAVGSAGLIRHYDGSAWTLSTQSGVATTQTLYRVFGINSNDVMAVGGNGTLLQYVNNNWSMPVVYNSAAKTDTLLALWGATATTVWTMGYNAAQAMYSYNNTAMTTSLNGYTNSPAIPTTTILHGIWGSSSGNMFAVASGGLIYHYTGSWTPVASPTTNELFAIWGTAAGSTISAAWAVGASGTLLRSNGTTWALESASGTVTTSNLNGVWAAPSNQVWAAGSAGALVHYDGTTWTSANSGTHNNLNAIWGINTGDIWAVGDSGTTLHYMP